MSNSISVNVRVDEDVKKQSEELLSQLGLTVSTAVNMFLRQIIRTGGIPFEVTTRGDSFYNPVNQKVLKESIARLEQGLGTPHNITEV